MPTLAIEEFRSFYLARPNIQNRIKTKEDADGNKTTGIFLSEAIELARENDLLLWTKHSDLGSETAQKDAAVEELKAAILDYAETGEGATDSCPTEPENTPPFTPATVDEALKRVRDTDNKICSW